MSRFENFTPPTLGSVLTSVEITLLEDLSALADSASGEFLRKESGSIVNSSVAIGDITPTSVTSSGVVRPATDDGAALGTSSAGWSDLYLAAGALIDWGSGAIQLTLSGTTLTLTGAVLNFSSVPTVGGNNVHYPGGTDVALADGGTGASLADPGADRILFWDDSLGATTWLTAGSGLSITSTTITATGTGIDWSEVTDTSESAAVNSGYILNNAGLVTLTIPTTAAVGDVVRVVGKGAGGWKVGQNASEIIHFGGTDTTTGTGGSLASTLQYDCVELVCTVANTEWTVMSSIGNITIV